MQCMWSFIFAIIISSGNRVEAYALRKAAFDITPDYIVMAVTGSQNALLYSEKVPLKFHGRPIYSTIQLPVIVQNLKDIATHYGADVFRGVVTVENNHPTSELQLAFGNEVPITVLSRRDGAKLAFESLAIQLDVESENLVVWNMGSTNFQLVYQAQVPQFSAFGGIGKYRVITSQWNPCFQSTDSRNITASLRDEGTGWASLVNHVTGALPNIPSELLEHLQTPETRFIGTGLQPRLFYELELLTTADILKRLEVPTDMFANLTLAYAMMQKLGLVHIEYVDLDLGLTPGVLRNPQYWK